MFKEVSSAFLRENSIVDQHIESYINFVERTMQEIVDAAGVIESNGFTTCDDLMHGFGGGYFPPILGTRSRPAGQLPAMTLEENMTVVVQPNVITREQSAGVQVGELIRVTRSGFERLHRAERGLFRVG